MIKLNKKNNACRYFFLALLAFFVTGCAEKTLILQPPPSSAFLRYVVKIKDKSVRCLPSNRQVNITCKPLMLTDIKLLPEETILSLNSGDTARWLFQVMVSNTDTSPTTHILIKPKEDQVKTNLVIATNQRTYHINLLSDDSSTASNILAFTDKSSTDVSIDQAFDSNYEIKIPPFQTIPTWAPSSVYNDGTSVYLYMPKLNKDCAPILHVFEEDNHPTIVNYSTSKNVYRIDRLFSRGMLTVGSGKHQEKVFINYIGIASHE